MTVRKSISRCFATSVDRAAKVTAQLVEHAGGSDKKVLFHPELAAFAKPKNATAARARKKATVAFGGR